jgi:adenosyl cobinamide kinase/adenosyl cobinamide phosphate guanylyltransferase
VNIQQNEVLARIDHAARTKAKAAKETDGQELEAPAYGNKHRMLIDTCVEGLVTDLCGQMEELHQTLKGIEQQVLQSAERARHVLNEHAAVCVRVNDEIGAMKTVINDLAEQARKVNHEP